MSTRIGLLAYRPVSTHDFAHDFSAPAPEFSGETDSLAEEDGYELAVPPRRKGYGEPLQANIAVSGLNL